jgi:hypothetical protein
VRAPKLHGLRYVSWLMFGGLALVAGGATVGWGWTAMTGMVSYFAGLATFGVYMRRVLSIARRRKVPTAALHLVGALAWLAVTTLALVVLSAMEDHAALRDFLVVGGAAGFVFQAILGAWSFLLPSSRAPDPELRRRELSRWSWEGDHKYSSITSDCSFCSSDCEAPTRSLLQASSLRGVRRLGR